MKKICIALLLAVLLISCSSNDYKNDIPLAELNKRWDAWLYRPNEHSEQSGFIIMKE